jgi:hypothetical protein
MKNENKNLIGTLVGVTLSVALIYVTVYYAGKGWKRSQEGEKIV